MRNTSFDLIVVGAGPAGSEAARRGAELGMRTLLLERRPLPRPKLCGGCVSLKAQRLLGEPIPDWLAEAPMTRVRLRIATNGGEHSTPGSYGTFVERGAFDSWLARRAQTAGAELRTETARRLDLSEIYPRIVTDQGSYRADAVVLATGADGPLTRAIRPPDPLARSAIGLECIVPAELCPSVDLAPGQAEFDFSPVRSGFSWGLHHGSHIYIGIGGLRTEAKAIHDGHAGQMARYGLEGAARGTRGHLIPCGGYQRALGRGRVLLAGDAGGFVDAFTGEGISLALQSGRLAAEVLAGSSGGHDDPVKLYTVCCNDEFSADLKWSLRMKRITTRAPRLLEALCSDSTVFSAYLAVFSGETDYPTFVSGVGKQILGGIAGRLLH